MTFPKSGRNRPRTNPRSNRSPVRDGRPSSLVEAVGTLADAGPEAADVIAEDAHDDHPLVRWVAVTGADAVRDDQVVVAALEDSDLRVRVAAAVNLARPGVGRASLVCWMG